MREEEEEDGDIVKAREEKYQENVDDRGWASAGYVWGIEAI